MRRFVCALALATLVTALVLTGCSTGRPSPAAGGVPHTGSAVGGYAPGTRLTLATGDTLVVPAGWRGQLLAAGALVATSAPGGRVEQPELGFVEVNVYGPYALSPGDFATALVAADQEYQRSRDGVDAGTMTGAGVDGTLRLSKLGRRVELGMGAETSATAYVSTWSSQPENRRVSARRRVDIYVSRAGIAPLRVFFDLIALPPDLQKASDSELPALLLKYIGFKQR